MLGLRALSMWEGFQLKLTDAELKSAHAVAVRAGAGMLLSTDPASNGDAHLESSPAALQIESAKESMADLALTAQKHKAQFPDEGKPEELPAIQDLQRSLETTQANSDGVALAGDGGLGSSAARQHITSLMRSCQPLRGSRR